MNPVSALRKLRSMTGELRRHPREMKFALRWLNSMLPGHSPLQDEVPWVTFRAIDWLDAYLKPDMKAFEYGAGGSTLYLAKRVRDVTSVEHDREFYDLVKSILAQRSNRNCSLMLHEPKACEESDREFASYQVRYKDMCFESYVKAIDDHPDKSLDFVLVDGRARVACVKRAVSKVAPGGAIMLDNSDRPAYRAAFRLLRDVPRYDFAGVTPWNLEVSQTSVWQIPLVNA
jgi:hypothetical protein